MLKLTSKPIVIILVIATIVVIALNVFVVLPKQLSEIEPGTLLKPSLPETVDQHQLQFSFAPALPEMPASLPVYEQAEVETLTQDQAQDYAQAFGVTAPAEPLNDIEGTFYSFTINENAALSVFPRPIRLVYESYHAPTSSTLSQEDLVDMARDFLSGKKLFSSSVSLGTPYSKLVQSPPSGEGIFEVADMSEAQFVQVFFEILLDGYPLIAADRQNVPVEMLLNLDGTVRQATITLFPNQFTPLGRASLAPVNEALEALNNGEGQIARLTNPAEVYTVLERGAITTAQLTSVAVVYLYDVITSSLQPYYRFVGNASTTDGNLLEIEVLITALRQEVFEGNE